MDHNDESLTTRDLASSREARAAAVPSSDTDTGRAASSVDQAPLPPIDDSDRTSRSPSETGGYRETGGLLETGDGAFHETGDLRATGDIGGSVREERPEQTTGRPGSAAETGAGADQDDHTGPLLPTDSTADLQRRWEEIQTQFVDEPRRAVEYADGLVATVMQQLAEGFAQERERLEAQWGRGEDISTEELRVTFRRYRSFFHRLLST